MNGLLLLDIDGPLNPYDNKPWRRPEGYQSYRLTPRGHWYTGRDFRRYPGTRVWLRPQIGPLLLELASDTGLELAWATAWHDGANRYVGPALGLPELPVIRFPDADFEPEPDGIGGCWRRHGSWKWPAVAAYAAGRPLAWLDDEFTDPHHQAARTAFEQARDATPTLLHHISPRHGIHDTDLDAIRAWHHSLR